MNERHWVVFEEIVQLCKIHECVSIGMGGQIRREALVAAYDLLVKLRDALTMGGEITAAMIYSWVNALRMSCGYTEDTHRIRWLRGLAAVMEEIQEAQKGRDEPD